MTLPDIPQPQAPARRPGCATQIIMGLGLLWVLGAVAAAQIGGWLVDEVRYEGGRGLGYTTGRLAISLGVSLAIVLIPLVLALIQKESPYRWLFITWTIGGIYTALLAPMRLVGLTQAQTANLVQIGVSLLFLAALAVLFWRRSGMPLSGRDAWSGWGPALLGAGLLAIPWALWGALGSPLDTLLNLIAGLCFGLVLTSIARVSLKWVEPAPSGKGITILNYTILAAVLATGFGAVGMEALLLVSVLGLGAGLAALAPVEREGPGWLSSALFAGLAAALPLMFFDPDELALIVGSGSGEVIGMATRTALVTLALSILVGIFFWVAVRRQSGSSRTWIFGAAGAWLIAIAMYALIGQPGFYGERLFVILKDQADLSQAPQSGDVAARRAWVYQALIDHADQTQAGLRSSLDRFHIAYTPYYLVNGLEVKGGALVRLWLASQPEVDRILDSPEMRPLPATPAPVSGSQPEPVSPTWNLSLIGADKVWNELGVTGAGIVVGQEDSGVQGDHPELADSYRGATSGSDAYNWLDPWNGSTSPQDLMGHGTHTLGTVLGDHTGVAPDATWFACVNLARNLGNPAHYLDCMQFMLAPYPQGGNPFADGDPALGANVVNNSWGCPDIEGCDVEALRPAARAMRAAGTFLAVSAGNSGLFGCGTVTDPLALYPEVYTVGAIDNQGNLAIFSSLGPADLDGSLVNKPDIVAPGVDVLSAYPGSTYEAADGTSMAGPHVAGVVALMWSANPQLIGQIDTTIKILDETATPYQGAPAGCSASGEIPNNASGWGVVNAYAAVRQALDYQP